MSTETETIDESPDVFQALQELLFPLLATSGSLARGIINLLGLPEFNGNGEGIRPVHEEDRVERGIIGFRRNAGRVVLAIACGTKMVHYLPLDKYVALIEQMHLRQAANIVIQNSKNEEKEKRPQIMARINSRCSAIHVVQGVAGKPISDGKDIVSNDAYYIPREELTSYYIAVKQQLDSETKLEDLIAANDGFKGYSINIDPLNPVG